MNEPKILVYDIESAGVNAFNADLGYVINFGYIWLSDFEKGKKAKVLSIADYDLYDKNPHDDSLLVQDAIEIVSQADGIIHHYGTKFDQPFLATRTLINKGNPFPETKALDTCYLAYKKLKLSSNRLKNVAKVLDCKYQKMEKLDGWPKWWLDYLKGGVKFDRPMRKYCAMDVMTLADISVKMRPYWPKTFVNYSVHTDRDVCTKCGSSHIVKHQKRIIGSYWYQLYQCQECGYSYNKQRLHGKGRGVFK